MQMSHYSYAHAIRDAAETLCSAGVPDCGQEALTLMQIASLKEPAELYRDLYEFPDARHLYAYKHLVRKRVGRVPCAYLRGYKEFMGLEFRVAPGVFIPRPESEIAVECAEAHCRSVLCRTGVDFGTGSGNLSVSLLVRFSGLHMWAVDKSVSALACARRNALRHGVSQRLRLVKADITEDNMNGIIPETIDLVIANPPYIKSACIDSLQPEVLQEPREALDGGEDGLDVYRPILAYACAALSKNGIMVFEMDETIRDGLSALVSSLGRIAVSGIHKDLAGMARVMVIRRIKEHS